LSGKPGEKREIKRVSTEITKGAGAKGLAGRVTWGQNRTVSGGEPRARQEGRGLPGIFRGGVRTEEPNKAVFP